jgi:hypothetical protein
MLNQIEHPIRRNAAPLQRRNSKKTTTMSETKQQYAGTCERPAATTRAVKLKCLPNGMLAVCDPRSPIGFTSDRRTFIREITDVPASISDDRVARMASGTTIMDGDKFSTPFAGLGEWGEGKIYWDADYYFLSTGKAKTWNN